VNFWKETFRIGNRDIPRFIGGPMDGFTDSPFRAMVRQFSPKELLYTEITHVGNLAFAPYEQSTLRFKAAERPLNFQITANTEDYLEHVCKKILLAGADMVDLNIGCPARNVVGSGSGSALMADIPRLKCILKKLRSCLPIPLTVKMRAGFKEQNAFEIALLAQDYGIDALVIHPRLQSQKFSGKVDYSLVAHIKQKLSIPVIISGGVKNADTAQKIYAQTGVDGFMVSRALCGSPWKLKELYETIQGNSFSMSSEHKLKAAWYHLDAMLDYYGSAGLYMFRKHLAFYLKGGPDACEFRRRLITSDSVEVVKEGLQTFFRARSEHIPQN